jgi:hypothetical protein
MSIGPPLRRFRASGIAWADVPDPDARSKTFPIRASIRFQPLSRTNPAQVVGRA